VNKKTKKAFTLIELMIVVAIIAFLASIAIPRYFKYYAKAQQAEVSMILASLHTAQEIYRAEHGKYSKNLQKIDWKPEGNFYYTYGFYFPGAQEGINYFVGKLKTSPENLGDCHAQKTSFLARAAGNPTEKDNIDLWSIDETRNIRHKK